MLMKYKSSVKAFSWSPLAVPPPSHYPHLELGGMCPLCHTAIYAPGRHSKINYKYIYKYNNIKIIKSFIQYLSILLSFNFQMLH